MKPFLEVITEQSPNDKLDKLTHNIPLSTKRLKQLNKFSDLALMFDFEGWQNYPPPSNSSKVAFDEIQYLIGLQDFRDQWEDDMRMHDTKVIKAFRKYVDKYGLEVDLDKIKKMSDQADSIILSLKRFYNRPRPKVLANKLGLGFSFFPLKTAETPSYPSGHATHGRLVAKLIADEVPFEHRANIIRLGEDIGEGRMIAGAHYPTDTNFGHLLGDELYRLFKASKPTLKLESLLTEIEFSNKAAMQAYNAKHKMRPTTKVKISGKETTAKDADPDAFKDDEKDKPKKKGKREVGKLSDKNDNLSDGEVKQKALDIGFKETADFKPAPGNAGSMLGEIMSGEVGSFLEDNPNMNDEEISQAIYDHVKDTELGKQNGDHTKKTNKSGKYEGKNVDLMKKCESIAKAGRVKHESMNKGIDKLQKSGKLGKSVKTRNYYGTKESIQKQVELIEKSDGKFYTDRGNEIPKDDLVDLIKKSGGGENPSDTSTIAIDDDGNAIVTFHSDKLSTNDIQANSTPNKESENNKKVVDSSNASASDKALAKSAIEKGQKALAKKEDQLKRAANKPAKEMGSGDMGKTLAGVKEVGDTKKHFASLTNKAGKPTPNIRPYLKGDGPHSEEEVLKAFYDFAGDDNREKELTGSQLKLLYRSAKQNDHDISKTLGRIREESLQIQRDTHDKLNKRSVELPDGTKKPMGDYIAAQDTIKQLHIGVVDGEDGEGVGKHPGLFNLNMGGVKVDEQTLKKCLNVNSSADFTKHFEVGKPGDGEEVTRNKTTGQITGRNIHVYATDKDGKRVQVATKTQRSKQGESGKLSTTMQWHKDTQKCFKGGK